MKTFAILLLTALSCFGQYRYKTSTLYTTSTNSSLAANTSVTVSESFSVAQGNTVDLQIYGVMITNAVTATNPVVATFRKSMDNSNWNGTFTVTLYMTTNAATFVRTNVSVPADAYIQLYTVTNQNAFLVTNLTVKAGQKIGL